LPPEIASSLNHFAELGIYWAIPRDCRIDLKLTPRGLGLIGLTFPDPDDGWQSTSSCLSPEEDHDKNARRIEEAVSSIKELAEFERRLRALPGAGFSVSDWDPWNLKRLIYRFGGQFKENVDYSGFGKDYNVNSEIEWDSQTNIVRYV
jgi:hypothetical protein